MNESVYVVTLAGKCVFNDYSIQYVIKEMKQLDKVRAKIKERYGIEFSEACRKFTFSYREYDNITDRRDIYLIVESIEVL